MKENKAGFAWLLRTVLLALTAISLLLFLITAALSSLFGQSLWSWMNVLRFVLGGGIIFLLVCYGFFLKQILRGGKTK